LPHAKKRSRLHQRLERCAIGGTLAVMFKRFVTTACIALTCMIARPVFAQDAPDAAPAEPASASAPAFATTPVVLETSMGDIIIALETERAPITAGNFLRYVDEGRFDGAVFYRAMKLDWDQPNGLIQGGAQNHYDRILDPIAHEPTSETGVLHEAGSLSMAMGEPGSATGDFSILLRAQPSMDADPDNEDPYRQHGFAAFGKVTDGMDVVLAIHAAPIDPDLGEGWMKGEMLANPVLIVKARRADNEEAATAE